MQAESRLDKSVLLIRIYLWLRDTLESQDFRIHRRRRIGKECGFVCDGMLILSSSNAFLRDNVDWRHYDQELSAE